MLAEFEEARDEALSLAALVSSLGATVASGATSTGGSSLGASSWLTLGDDFIPFFFSGKSQGGEKELQARKELRREEDRYL